MRDRIDQRQEHQLDTQPGADVGPRLEMVAGHGRRREWPAAEKARIIVESLMPGAVVSEVARRNGLSPQHLSSWRREARELFTGDRCEARATSAAGTVQPSPSTTHGAATSKTRGAAPTFVPPTFVPPTFVPVVVAAGPSGSAPQSNEADVAQRPGASRTDAIESGAIEIVIGRSVVRVSGRVDTDALTAVIEIVRRLACS